MSYIVQSLKCQLHTKITNENILYLGANIILEVPTLGANYIFHIMSLLSLRENRKDKEVPFPNQYANTNPWCQQHFPKIMHDKKIFNMKKK